MMIMKDTRWICTLSWRRSYTFVVAEILLRSTAPLVMLFTSTDIFFFFSSRRRHTRCSRDWSSDVCSSDLHPGQQAAGELGRQVREHDRGGLRVLGLQDRQQLGRVELAHEAERLVAAGSGRGWERGGEGKRGELGGRRII